MFLRLDQGTVNVSLLTEVLNAGEQSNFWKIGNSDLTRVWLR